MRSLRGARQRALLYTSDSLCDDGGPAPSTQTASTAPTAARASRLIRPSVPRRATGLPTPVATTAAPARSSARPRADGMSMWTGGRASSVGQFVTSSVCTSQDNYSVKRKICAPPIRETTNGGGEAGGSTLNISWNPACGCATRATTAPRVPGRDREHSRGAAGMASHMCVIRNAKRAVWGILERFVGTSISERPHFLVSAQSAHSKPEQ